MEKKNYYKQRYGNSNNSSNSGSSYNKNSSGEYNSQRYQQGNQQDSWKRKPFNGHGNGSNKSNGNNAQSGNRPQRRPDRDVINARDERFGFSDISSLKDADNEVEPRLGFLFNFLPALVPVPIDIASGNDNNKGDIHDDDNNDDENELYGHHKESKKSSSASNKEGSGGSATYDRQALELFFCQQNGDTFKVLVFHDPYFYLMCDPSAPIKDVKLILERKFEDLLESVDIVQKVDLDMPNHLSGMTGTCLKLSFQSVQNLLAVRKELLPIVTQNKSRARRNEQDGFRPQSVKKVDSGSSPNADDLLLQIIDIREYDVPYDQRVSIDCDINVGCWYTVHPGKGRYGGAKLAKEQLVAKADLRILAFDIECTKQPLKFPDSKEDQVFMISYVVNGDGYLIINRSIVSEDIRDFDYTPKPEFPCHFKVFNERDEKATLARFFHHCQEIRPNVFVTYNGDWFDWPFIEARAAYYGMSMENEIGVGSQSTPQNQQQFQNQKKSRLDEEEDEDDKEKERPEIQVSNSKGEYTGRCSVHLDCLYWVNRDSYLPAGSRGLKAVTKAKLGYDPIEVDPEHMVEYARERPTHMADYSVSDAVATFYLYQKYIHSFIFSLCTIIPMGADDVLRRGSGTLCETLLMVEARKRNIICPNKQVEAYQSFTDDGHLLEQETYVGGHVECLESGVFRDDLPVQFNLGPKTLQKLCDNLDRDLSFAVKEQLGDDYKLEEALNYSEVKATILSALEKLRDEPDRKELPCIYHLDVAAMYPNIILTNRLQPHAIVNDSVCSSCIFNRPESNCKRPLTWEWRGDYYPASRAEVSNIVLQLEHERVAGVPFNDLPQSQQNSLIRERLKGYCMKTKKRAKASAIKQKIATTCQRENPFYVDTVRAFRDRRYEYKQLTKDWEKKVKASKDELERDDAEVKVVLYESLQLAHKCILNSFYGYVMRKGARWHSMEMAGVVTHTGGLLIKQARALVDCIGRPLELDTDGIWCIIPNSFPQNFTLKFNIKDTQKEKAINVSYLCLILNADVHSTYTNHQYQVLKDEKTLKYETKTENSIFFELDGPYKCMVLPASTEEGKLLKKRYAVFHKSGKLAELKGFELKRRGELKIVKIFQSQVFEKFLEGSTLEECYASVAKIANLWLDVLVTRGAHVTDEELIELISENRSMSKTLAEYGAQKSTSISTAKRLAQFLGEDVVKEKGLACKLLIANRPIGAPTTERAIPTAIFSAPVSVRNKFLREWLKDRSIQDADVRSIIDWEYYIDRLGKVIQKIITIPAALQRVSNPVPLVSYPDWLVRIIREKTDTRKQKKINDAFRNVPINKPAIVADIEDFGSTKVVQSTLAIEHNQTIEIENVNEKEPANEKEDSSKFDEPGFAEWLAARTTSWRNRRLLKKRMEDERNGWESGTKRRNAQLSQANQASALASTTSSVSSVSASQNEGKSKLQQGLVSFARAQKVAEQLSYWQVIEFRQEVNSQDIPVPGLYRILALTPNQTMTNILIRASRKLVINSLNRFEDEVPVPKGVRRRKVQRILPHNHQVYHLYELEMSEDMFRQNPKELAMFLNRPEIQGVYESQLPHEQRLIYELGCVIRLDRTVAEERRKAQDRSPIDSSNLEFLSTETYAYLEGEGSSTYKRIFISHSGTRDRHVVSVYFVDDSSDVIDEQIAFQNANQNENENPILLSNDYDGEIKYLPKSSQSITWIVSSRTASAARLVKPNPKQFLKQILGDEATDNTKITDAKVVNLTSMKECWDQLSAELTKYQSEGHGPTIIITQSLMNKSGLMENVPGLREFPIVSIRCNDQDNIYPALQWQQHGVRQSVLRYLAHTTWWINRIQCSRYAHIPVAHLADDHPITISDVFMSRMLTHNNFVLWSSPSPVPDLGGFEKEVVHLSVVDEEESPQILIPGSYRSICIEFKVAHLAIAAILESSKMLELDPSALLANTNGETLTSTIDANVVSDGQDMSTFVGSSSSSLANTLFSSKGGNQTMRVSAAFKILRAVVQSWYQDVMKNHNPFADLLLVHFYRWLCSSESLLHDPALHLYIHSLMKKLFFHLINEIRNLGGTIVQANFQKIVVCTGKKDLESAYAFCDHLTNTLYSKPMFSLVRIIPQQSWGHFLFMDEYNFGGLELTKHDFIKEANDIFEMRRKVKSGEYQDSDPELISAESSNDNSVDGDDHSSSAGEYHSIMKRKYIDVEDDPEIIFHWNVYEYLPESVRDYFTAVVGHFISKPYKHRREWMQQQRENAADGEEVHQHFLDQKYDSGEESQYLKTLVRNKFGRKLLEIIPEIQLHHMGKEEFPILPGSHLPFTNPALEFVKTLCAILELDAVVEEEVMVVKKSLLTMLQASFYSSDTKFMNPSLSLVLKDVICTYCNFCCDLDLLRDPRLAVIEGNEMAEQEYDDERSDDAQDDKYEGPKRRDIHWCCVECNQPYDREAIEGRLVEKAKQISLHIQLLDLVCSKCGQQRSGMLSQYCDCAGPWALPKRGKRQVHQSAMSLAKERLQPFLNAARYHNFPWLQETVEWLLLR